MLATRNFLQNEKILFLAKVITFLNLENTGNYNAVCAQTLIAIPCKLTLNLSSPTNFKLQPRNFVVML